MNILIVHLLICRDLPPSQGGKYVGFGSTPNPPAKKEDDLMASLSSVSFLYRMVMLQVRPSVGQKDVLKILDVLGKGQLPLSKKSCVKYSFLVLHMLFLLL